MLMTGWSRSVRAALTFALVVGALSGCDLGGPEGAIGFETRDSSGVRVVVNPADLTSRARAYVLEEVVRIGAVSGRQEEEFGALMDLAVGEGEGEFVREFELVRKIHAEVERVRLADADLERAIRESASFRGEEDARELGAPDFLPVLGKPFVSPSGRLLVHRRDLSESAEDDEGSGIWDLLDPDGRIVGRVTIHEDLRTYNLVLTDARLYAIARDDLDVQYIVGYEIVPGAASDPG